MKQTSLEPLSEPGASGYRVQSLVRYYRLPTDFDGSGVSVAIVALAGGFRRSDLQVFFTDAGLATPRIDEVSLRGATNNPATSPDASVELQSAIEILGAAAPGVRIGVYVAENTEAGIADGIVSAIHSDHTIICLPWTVPESSVSRDVAGVVGEALNDAVALGRVVCAPAFDITAQSEATASFPGCHPFVVACGPTIPAHSASQVVEQPAVAGDGGPVSSRMYARPPWQKGLDGRGQRGDGGRLVPDVSALTFPYRCYVNGDWYAIGTYGAPVSIWGALLARLKQAGRHWNNKRLYELVGPRGVLRAVVPAPERGSKRAWSVGGGWGSPNGERLLSFFK